MGKVWRTLNESYLLKSIFKSIVFYLRPLLFKPVLEADPDGTKAFDKFVPQASLQISTRWHRYYGNEASRRFWLQGQLLYI